MKKIMLIILGILLIPTMCFAAGSSFTVKRDKISQDGTKRIITVMAIADDTNGTIPELTLNSATTGISNGSLVDWVFFAAHIYGDHAVTHDGSNNAAVLSDTSGGFNILPLSTYVGYTLYNTTDSSSGTISAATSSTITATLAGGTQNDWDTGGYVQNLWFYNNILANSDSYLVSLGALMSGGRLGGNYYLYNNTFYHTNTENLPLFFDGEADLLVFKNNIVISPENDAGGWVSFYPDSYPTINSDLNFSNNVYYGETSNYPSWDTSTLKGSNPLLTNGSTAYNLYSDFTIGTGSPAIDAGSSDVNGVVGGLDFLSKSYGTYEIGAFSFSDEEEPPAASSPVSGLIMSGMKINL